MSDIITSFIPFPNIYWWASIADANSLMLDKVEHFEKMTYRNRYYISGSNGLIQLSIPLANGRNQRAAMAQVEISNRDRWQQQHWRTLVSVYKRAPYFEFYEMGLQQLFETSYKYLVDFNLASMQWLCKQLELTIREEFADEYIKEYPALYRDIRSISPGLETKNNADFPLYYQLFQERTGFLANLSIIDLLFSEGPFTMSWIRSNRAQILASVK